MLVSRPLTQTRPMKKKRHTIRERYRDEIDDIPLTLP